jgi:hypothetical protein
MKANIIPKGRGSLESKLKSLFSILTQNETLEGVEGWPKIKELEIHQPQIMPFVSNNRFHDFLQNSAQGTRRLINLPVNVRLQKS